jgi:putative endopeptidase
MPVLKVFVSRITLCALLLTLPVAVLGQNVALNSDPAATGGAAAETTAAPKLEHFEPDLIDKSLNPCDDFYKFSCNKWIAANPIPPDQVFWDTGSGLQVWNETTLRDTLEAASKTDAKRSETQQKIGDYWAACMDLSGIEAAGLKPLQPELNHIAAIKSKKEITLEIARLHHLFPGAWEGSDNQTNAPFFGFSGGQDYDDASKVVAQIDQGGLSLPNRDYYIKTDDKSVETLKKFRAHVQKMFVLAGEPETQAATDAGIVIELETALAQAQMDNIKRRDPKNINNKMSLAQVRALTPSIDWDAYLKAAKAPASEHYIVSAPEFFRAEDKLIVEHPLDHWKTYMRWQAIHHAAPFLGKAHRRGEFRFLRAHPGRTGAATSALAALHPGRRPRSGRGSRPGLC